MKKISTEERQSIIIGLIILAVSILFYSQIGKINTRAGGFQTFNAALWSKLVIILLGVSGLIMIIQNLVRYFLRQNIESDSESENMESGGIKIRLTIFLTILTLVVYVAVLNTIGFVLSTPLLVIAIMLILDERKIGRIMLIAVLADVSFWLIFCKLAGAIPPRGIGVFRYISSLFY